MKCAVVTGAGSGLGEAILLQIAARGWAVAMVGRNREKLETVRAALSTACPKAVCYAADLADDRQLTSLISALKADFPRVDLLLHAAGAFDRGTLDSSPVEALDAQYRVNVRAPYALTRALLPELREQRGQVIFLNSTAGISAGPGISAYAATKHALKAIADSLREEVNVHQVRVVSVFLGRVATPMQERIHAMEDKTYRPERLIQPEDAAAIIVQAIECPPSAEITDIRVRPLRKPHELDSKI